MAETDPAPEWRQIQGFPDYEASRDGVIRRRTDHPRLRTQPTGHVVPQWLTRRAVPRRDGTITDLSYLSVSLYDPIARMSRNRLVHVLVAEAFHGPRPTPRHQAAHCDGDRYNNRASNLRWATPEENQADRIAHGTSNTGSRHGMAKLSESDVAMIKMRLAFGHRIGCIAADFHISHTSVWNIKAGRIWKHVASAGSAQKNVLLAKAPPIT